MRLPKWNSTTAKTIRTTVYELAGLLLAVLANPSAVELIKQYYPQVLVILTATAPILTFIVNFTKKDVENY